MAEFVRSSALERTAGTAGDSLGPALVDTIVDEADLRVHTVDATQVIIAVHVATGVDAPALALLDARANVTREHPLPAPNTRSGDDDSYVVWLDPSRWLAVSSIDERWRRLRELQAVVAGVTREAAVSDASDALLVLDITGARAAALMTMACALDIESPSFAQPRTARAPFVGVAGAVLYRHRDGFRVHVDAALTAHVREWLGEAARLLPGNLRPRR